MAHREEILTPVGRLVQGSLYSPNTKDAEGKALVFKTGDKAGQTRTDYYIAIAVPKGAEKHWSETEWGAKIWSVGHKGFPNGQGSSPTFAWKITDGDSTIPNRKGTVPVNCDGFKGCWILKFSGSIAPTILTLNPQNKTVPLIEKDAIRPGDFIQISGSVADNESQQQPGVYLNHNLVCFRGYGERIVLGIDPDSVGFGIAPLPPGASSLPPALVSVPVTAPALPQGAGTPPVAPYTAILTPPQPPVTASRMTAAATASYAEYIANGWTDTLLIQHGLMNP